MEVSLARKVVKQPHFHAHQSEQFEECIVAVSGSSGVYTSHGMSAQQEPHEIAASYALIYTRIAYARRLCPVGKYRLTFTGWVVIPLTIFLFDIPELDCPDQLYLLTNIGRLISMQVSNL